MKISIDSGIRLWCDIDGVGLIPDGDSMRAKPTLLLMHGGPGSDHSAFKPAFDAMTDVCQVVYYDHRGQGRSDKSTSDNWNLSRWADDAVELCNALGIEKPFVLGNSFGGFVAQRMASRHPGFAQAYIFNSTRSDNDRSAMYVMFQKLGGQEAHDAARTFWEAPSEEAMAKAAMQYLKICGPLYTQNRTNPFEGNRAVRSTDVLTHYNQNEGPVLNLLPELAMVQDPVLVITGELDPVTPATDAELTVKALPQHLVQFERFAKSGHGVYRDEPERYFEVLKAFVNAHSSALPAAKVIDG